MKRQRTPYTNPIRMTVAAVFLLVLLQWYGPGGYAHRDAGKAPAATAVAAGEADAARQSEREEAAFLAAPQPAPAPSAPAVYGPFEIFGPFRAAARPQPWRANAVAVTRREGVPVIAIVIDDVGMDRKDSFAAMDLEAPLTLSFLPYAPGVEKLALEAREKGHEIMIHMPMEPLNGKLDMGPIALRAKMGDAEIDAMLQQAFAAMGASRYVGMNNHMGSRFTANRHDMDVVMAEMKKRGLLFLDSRTTNKSEAVNSALAFGVPYAVRNVFLDNEADSAAIGGSLEKTERIARRHGAAIAIGHPRPATIAALRKWLPELKKKGFQLVPVSALAVVPPAPKAALLPSRAQLR
jgi:polysaccharide deacetylase 2 family uncharacterized protein YibQ